MAGPQVMALGDHVFEALGFGFTGITRELETPWAEVERTGTMSDLHWQGPTREALSIRGVIFPIQFGGQETLNNLRSAAQRGDDLMLVTLAGVVSGRHVVTGISEEMEYFDRNGAPQKTSYVINLQREARQRRDQA